MAMFATENEYPIHPEKNKKLRVKLSLFSIPQS